MFMGYFDPVVKYGLERYIVDAADADLIYMAAPTTTEARLEQIGEKGSGFVYCVAVTGVTGARESLSASLGDYLGRVRRHTDLPLAVGFGISTPEHVAEVRKVADGAIVASALINYTDGFPMKEQPERAARFVRYLKGDVALA
jgi:tryptophan synthase alpha chain